MLHGTKKCFTYFDFKTSILPVTLIFPHILPSDKVRSYAVHKISFLWFKSKAPIFLQEPASCTAFLHSDNRGIT